VANAFWTVAYDTAYAMADKPDDLKIGIKTSAITFGDHDVTGIMLCHAVFIIMMTGIGLHLSWVGPSCRTGHQPGLDCQAVSGNPHRDRGLCFKAFWTTTASVRC
jgi:4-hydroxybenzoate polyprenyltransferase